MNFLKTLILFILPMNLLLAKDSKNLADYYLGEKRFVWQGSKDLNHFYYDFNGDKKIDAFDVIVNSGVDYYFNRSNNAYKNKVSLRKVGNNLVETYFVKENMQWKEINSQRLSFATLGKEVSNKCQNIDPLIVTSTYDKFVNCLKNELKGGELGKNLIQKVTSALRGDSSEKKHYINNRSKISFQCQNNRETFNCHHNLSVVAKSQEEVSEELFHYYMHLGGISHVISKVDLVYACTQCCMSDNEVACKICSSNNKFELKSYSQSDDILSLFIYDNYVNSDQVFPQYHNALVRVHKNLDKDKLVPNLMNSLKWSKDKIIERFYIQLSKHLDNKVNMNSNSSIYFSDMISEIMAKIACTDLSKTQYTYHNNNCEIMYLARSIPSSLCFEHKDKKSCQKNYLEGYLIRKKQYVKGIRLPANFGKLNSP